MKNLLYTLLIGLVVISCNKDEEYGSAPLALSQEVSIEQTFDAAALESRLVRILGNSSKMATKSGQTAKTAVVGSNIKLISGLKDGNYFEFLFSDDIDNCDAAGFTGDVLFLVFNASNETEIRFGSVTGTLLNTITIDLSTLYTLTFSEGLRVDLSSLAATVVDGTGGTSFTFN